MVQPEFELNYAIIYFVILNTLYYYIMIYLLLCVYCAVIFVSEKFY